MKGLFAGFERVIGPVGGAKVLHLFAPGFLPLWDNPIAKAYGLPLHSGGPHEELYWRFVLVCREQVRSLGGIEGHEALKLLDEYNYCRFTKGWLD